MAKKTVAFELDVSTGGAEKDMSQVEKRLREINERVSAGNMEFSESRQLLNEYKTIALQAGRESPIGREAIDNAAILRSEVADLDNEINRLAQSGQAMQGALAVAQTTLTGYSAFQGVTAMLGQENEVLLETLTKLQGAQSSLMAIEQIRAALEKESVLMLQARVVWTRAQTAASKLLTTATGTATVATKAFTAALIATGVGAIAAAVGLLIANFDKLKDAVMGLIPGLKTVGGFFSKLFQQVTDFVGVTSDATREVDKMVEASERMRTENDLQIKKLQALGNEEEKIYELRRQTLESEQAALALKKKNGLATDEEIARLRELGVEIEILDIIEDKRLAAVQAKSDEEAAKKAEARKKELDERRKQTKAKRKLEEEEKKAKRKLEEEEMEAIRQMRLANDATDLERMKAKWHDEREAIIEKYGTETELLKLLKQQQLNELNAWREEQEEIQREKDEEKRQLKLEKRQEEFEEDMEWMQLSAEERNLAEMNFLNQLLADKLVSEEEYAQRKKEIDQNIENNQAQMDAALVASKQAAVSAISGMLGQLAQAAGEGTATAKAAAVAQIAIDTATGLSAAISGASSAASAGGPAAPFLLALYIAQGIGTVLGTISKAKTLLDTVPGGGGTPSVSVPRPNLPSPDTVGGFEHSENRVIVGSNTTEQAPPSVQKVVVLASDVSDVNEENEMIDTVSTWG